MAKASNLFDAARRQVCATVAAAVILAGVASAPASAQSAPPILPPDPTAGLAGIWFDDTGKGAVEIGMCGDVLCGRIVWLQNPNDKAGRPLTDGYNPEAAKRVRPICGLPVLGDLRRQRDGAWDLGWIYDPKEGKSYDVELKLRAPDRLQVTGYLGTKFFSESFIWTRAPVGIQRCKTTSASITQ